MPLNLSLPPKPASERDPAAYTEGFQAGIAAERSKWVEAGALKGNEPASAARVTAEPKASAWDAIVNELNTQAGVSAPVKG